ncbi:MAG: hypothetical protein HY275_05675 [Gemmatimonadetes bacterium]|nr:hypothetical protein [Gemmatimonadota bacterium]
MRGGRAGSSLARKLAATTGSVAALVLLPMSAAARATAQEPPSTTRVDAPGLPVPVTNNAVATIARGPGAGVYSMLGVDSTKSWRGITRRAFHLPSGASRWRELPPVPGASGRLAALAFGVKGRVFLLGGYTVDSVGHETSLPRVDIWDPAGRRWRAGAPMPVAVDDAMGGVWHDSLIVIVSGWHDTDNVNDVQWYNPTTNRWTRGTPFPGVQVFGGAGGVLGDEILVVDGARRVSGKEKYALTLQAWLGAINPKDPAEIRWSRMSPHPGPARYRAAIGACGRRFYLAGGTDNAYNYDGFGYDGHPSAPTAQVLSFEAAERTWWREHEAPAATMDLRGMAIVDGNAWLVGGMRAGQRVSDEVTAWALGCPVR